jgi:hypothetical protein
LISGPGGGRAATDRDKRQWRTAVATLMLTLGSLCVKKPRGRMSTGDKVKWALAGLGVSIAWVWAATPTCLEESGIILQGCLSQRPIDPNCREIQYCTDHFGHQWYLTTYPDGTVVKSEVQQSSP